MSRKYFSARNKRTPLSINEFYSKLGSLYLYFRDKDYFKEKAGITSFQLPKEITQLAALSLDFQPFPITKWPESAISENHIFDVFEFLYDYASRPEGWANFTERGFNYEDYETYDEDEGKIEFREKANEILFNYREGYEMDQEGEIRALGANGIQHILDADIIKYDEQNVDLKVQDAIRKWQNRNLSLMEKREAIRELADVFEWLKKTKKLGQVLNKKDEAALFDIANNFAIRHHNPQQRANYDKSIWYSWMFHFYLASYHAIIRLLIKKGIR